MEEWDLIVIGGGAAGYFGAIACAEACPTARVLILEATGRVLTKVKVSGGGRCNVTHFPFDTKQLAAYYPRGPKELRNSFHRFQPTDTIDWFARHGVELKREEDGRMFPTTDHSQTIIDCLDSAAQKSGVILKKNSLVEKLEPQAGDYIVHTRLNAPLKTRCVLLASGSMSYGLDLVRELGHCLISPVPSLFTFEIQDPLLEGLAGISFPLVRIVLKSKTHSKTFVQEGPCLITHWGLSGPAVLKLSAFAARELHESAYQATLHINWLWPLKTNEVLEKLERYKQEFPKQKISKDSLFSCTRRFWDSILKVSGFREGLLFGESSKKQLQELAHRLTECHLSVTGKGVFKEEFVTAGGISRDEIDFRSMESKLFPGLYFAGEVIDVDGITGGFNFQNAWTGSWIAGQAIANFLSEEACKPT